jgi:hypothetical protein
MIYPKHTPVTAIIFFDRSTKVVIECMNHEGSVWMTKDPFVSNWFAHFSNSDAFGNAAVNCDCKADQYWTAEEYHDGKGDTVYGANPQA